MPPDTDIPHGDNMFGLAPDRATSRIRLLPVPFDATTSYGRGTVDGPHALHAASSQLDLHDLRYGRIDRVGIHLDEEPPDIRHLNTTARELADTVVALGERGGADERTLDELNAAGAWVGTSVRKWAAARFEDDVIPGVIGGEHSVSYGAIKAAANRFGGLGVLQLDAHMDLREAYLGMEWSHASVMWNVMERLPAVTKLVQIGIRDFCSEEEAYVGASGGRVVTHFDYEWYRKRDRGVSLAELAERAIEALPEHVYVSFDIDALSPDLCPSTGTPVPGGLSFNDAALILETLARSERTIVGFDLVEVAPSEVGELDANVGMRVLYQLCGAAVMSQG